MFVLKMEENHYLLMYIIKYWSIILAARMSEKWLIKFNMYILYIYKKQVDPLHFVAH